MNDLAGNNSSTISSANHTVQNDANEFNAIMDKYTRETIEEQLESAITLVKKEIEAKRKSQNPQPIFPILKSSIPSHLFQLMNEYEQEVHARENVTSEVVTSESCKVSSLPEVKVDLSAYTSLCDDSLAFPSTPADEKITSRLVHDIQIKVKKSCEENFPPSDVTISSSSVASKSITFSTTPFTPQLPSVDLPKQMNTSYMIDLHSLISGASNGVYPISNPHTNESEESSPSSEEKVDVKEEPAEPSGMDTKEVASQSSEESAQKLVKEESVASQHETQDKSQETQTQSTEKKEQKSEQVLTLDNTFSGEFVDGFEYVTNLINYRTVPYVHAFCCFSLAIMPGKVQFIVHSG